MVPSTSLAATLYKAYNMVNMQLKDWANAISKEIRVRNTKFKPSVWRTLGRRKVTQFFSSLCLTMNFWFCVQRRRGCFHLCDSWYSNASTDLRRIMDSAPRDLPSVTQHRHRPTFSHV